MTALATALLPLAAALVLSASPAVKTPTSKPAPAAPAAPAGPTAAVPHLPGERMDFAISFGGFKAGEARLSVGQRAGALLPVFLEARTTGLIGLIALKQHLVSYLDTATGLPRTSRLDGVEPSYRHTDTARFDRAEGTATVREVGRFDKTHRIEVPPGTLDFVALVFRLRTLPLPDGSSHEFKVLAGRTVSKVVATVVGRETVETRAGNFPAVKVRVPTGLTGKFSEKSPTFIWFSDDARRVVVRISTDFAIGRASALLASYTPGREAS